MNFINNIRIKNFKSIKDVTINGCKRINVFIGEPNVGKSNILEGLGLFGYLLIDSSHYIKLNNLVRIKDFQDLFYNGDINKGFEIDLNNSEFVVEGTTWPVSVLELKIFRFLNTGISENDNNFTELKREILTKLTFGTPDFQAGSASYKPYKATEGNFGSILKYEYNPSKINERSYVLNPLEVPYGENLYKVISANSEIKDELVELLQEYKLQVLFDNSVIKIIKKRSDGTFFMFPFDHLADTFKRLVFCLAAIKSNKNSVLLFEEPEAHLFPPYISHITSEMIYDKSNQYFVATHSEYFLTDLLEDAREDLAVYVVGYKNGETIIHKLTDAEMHEVYNDGVNLFLNIKNYVS